MIEWIAKYWLRFNQWLSPKPVTHTYYEVDWDKVKTVKDIVFIVSRAESTKLMWMAEEVVEATPHWKNLTVKRTVQV